MTGTQSAWRLTAGKKLLVTRLLIALATLGLLALPLLVCPERSFRNFAASVNATRGEPLSLAQAMSLKDSSWQPYSGYEVHYITPDTWDVWLKVLIPKQKNASTYVAELAFPFLYDVNYYLTDAKSPLNDTVRSGQPRVDPLPTFGVIPAAKFSPSPDRDQVLYVHCRYGQFVEVPLVILTERDFQIFQLGWYIILGLCFGGLLSLIFYNTLVYFLLRDRILLYYILYQVGTLAVLAIYSGLMQPVLAKFTTNFETICRSAYIIGTLAVLALAQFSDSFLSLKVNFPIFRRLKVIAIAIALVYVILVPILPVWLLFQFLCLYIALGVLMLLAVTPYYISNGVVFYFLFSFMGLAFSVAVPALAALDAIPATMLTTHYYLISGVWQALFFSFAMVSRIASLQREREKIIEALQADAPGARLNDILRNPFRATVKSSEMRLTIVSIDIVAFSTLSERDSKRRIFDELARRMNQMTEIVHKYRGIVDRTLGDSLLCVFGYDEPRPKDQARHAFLAAKEIQEQIVREIIADAGGQSLILPVRIGVHTADFQIGNLMAAKNSEVSLIGKGLSYVSQLEAGCAPFKIILSEATHRLVDTMIKDKGLLSQVMIAMKHDQSLMTAFEYNPFANHPEDLRFAEECYFAQSNAMVGSERFTVDPERRLNLSTDLGLFTIVDFSLTGFGVTGGQLFARKARFWVRFMPDDLVAGKALKSKCLDQIYVEVRWSRVQGAKHRHGLQIVGLNDKQKEYVFQTIKTSYVRSVRESATAEALLDAPAAGGG